MESGISSLCFVLTPLVAESLSQQLEAELRAEFGTGIEIEGKDDQVWMVNLDEEVELFISYNPARIPDEEAESNADGNIFWPDAREELGDYHAHVIVGLLSGIDDPIESNFLVSRAVRIVFNVFGGIGAYWGAAGLTHSRQVFLGMLKESSPEEPPFHLWIRFQAVLNDDDSVGFYTLGMAQFDLMEIEVESCDWDPLDLTDFVYNVARYLIENGPVIQDGNTVGGDENEKILVRFAPSLYGDEDEVYRICIE